MLLGAVSALVLRGLWEVARDRGDRTIRVATGWGCFVFVLLSCRVVLDAVPQLDPSSIEALVRMQYFAALAAVPVLLVIVLRTRSGYLIADCAIIGLTALVAACTWIDGVVFGSAVATRITFLGTTYLSLAPGPLLPWVGVTTSVAGAFAIGRLNPSRDLEDRDLRALVRIGTLVLVPAGMNECLLDAGIIRSARLLDAACFVVLLLVGIFLARRSRLAYSDARSRIEAQTEILQRHRRALETAERRSSLGALAAGVGHEINNPLTVVTINLQAAATMLRELRTDFGARAARTLDDAYTEACGIVDSVRNLAEAKAESASEVDGRLSTVPPNYEDGRAATRLTILVVDDEPQVAQSLQRLLGKHDVSIAADGYRALEQLRKGSVDFVLCDAMMPGMSGPELLQTLRAEGLLKNTGFAFVTGGVFAPDVATAVRESRLPVLSKPVDKRDLDACTAAFKWNGGAGADASSSNG